MDTRWATVDGVRLRIPDDATAKQLRDALYKPEDAVLIGVTGDLVTVVHEEERSLSELIAGCADTYYFRRDGDLERPGVPELSGSSELSEVAATGPANTDAGEAETTFERPDVNP
ncbi:hypothetical protein [Halobiforma nitratireducens]|uniref:Uncharacterized protein n=1 Tax=Halobiforma nitratireducens JCM 10879 TaxID=1227454 RepID=M0MMJ4_9EURY|nr:hypothetical protein [Halobiforma nitratireducens]EMA45959.1 hypothetical protein C446_01733 [Halobiforma nitratireducens JCM 10879]